MFSTIEDESRYREVLQSKIDRGELLKTRKFSTEPPGKKARRKERAEREAVEAEQHARDLGISSGGDLSALILARSAQRHQAADSMFDALAAKYGGATKGQAAGVRKVNQAAEPPELDDAAFDAAQKRLLSAQRARKTKR